MSGNPGSHRHGAPYRACARCGAGLRDAESFTRDGGQTHHADQLTLRLPPNHQLLTEILTRLRALPTTS